RARGEAAAGPARHLPLFPAAVQPGAERDRDGVPPGEIPRDAGAEPHDPPRPARGGPRGLHRLRPAASTQTSRKTTSGCLASSSLKCPETSVSNTSAARVGFFGSTPRVNGYDTIDFKHVVVFH